MNLLEQEDFSEESILNIIKSNLEESINSLQRLSRKKIQLKKKYQKMFPRLRIQMVELFFME